ncbi:Galactosyl transferase [Klebsormidium nitens]|uniref:Galactosyl transferase n=1 Tax=Klebsormidium nitens TaxID=105231 RepID=A0A1Y1HQS7_KLENI|nr:Galactosyl transferase [Klebsormidium nitens]|eukprot:GAQ78946.1 Galactosyl transferase [Klebsormidium nitens]
MPPHSHEASFRGWIPSLDDSELTRSGSGLELPKLGSLKRRRSPPPGQSKMGLSKLAFVMSLIFCGATCMLLAWPREGVSDDEDKWGPEAVQKSGRLLQAEESWRDPEVPLGTYIPEELPAHSDSSTRNPSSSSSLLSVETAVVPRIMLKTEDVAGESHNLLSSTSDISNQEPVQDPLPLSASVSDSADISENLKVLKKPKENSPDSLALDRKGFGTLVTENKQTAPRAKMMMVTGVDSATCSTERGMEIGMKGLQNKMDYARLHKIDLWYSLELFDEKFDIYWMKYPLLKKLMLANPDIEWFMWIDSDAIFTDMTLEIPFEKYKDHDIVYTGSPKAVYEDAHWLALNAGVFLIRNSQWSFDYMAELMRIGEKGEPRNSYAALLNKKVKGRKEISSDWPADDQCTVVYLLSSFPDKWGKRVYLDEEIQYHHWWLNTFEDLEKMQLGNGVNGGAKWPFVSHFTGCKFCHAQGADPERYDSCLENFDKIYHFAMDQVLRPLGLKHKVLGSPQIVAI